MKFWADLLFYLVLALLASPVYIVVLAGIRYGQRRFWPGQPHARRWAHLGALLATPLLGWIGFRLALALYLYYPHRNFDVHRWATEPTKRYEMVEDLRASHQLIGLTEEQVIALLGEPDIKFKVEGSWEYYLGMRPKLIPIDGDALSLEFSNGKVIRFWVHET